MIGLTAISHLCVLLRQMWSESSAENDAVGISKRLLSMNMIVCIALFLVYTQSCTPVQYACNGSVLKTTLWVLQDSVAERLFSKVAATSSKIVESCCRARCYNQCDKVSASCSRRMRGPLYSSRMITWHCITIQSCKTIIILTNHHAQQLLCT